MGGEAQIRFVNHDEVIANLKELLDYEGVEVETNLDGVIEKGDVWFDWDGTMVLTNGETKSCLCIQYSFGSSNNRALSDAFCRVLADNYNIEYCGWDSIEPGGPETFEKTSPFRHEIITEKKMATLPFQKKASMIRIGQLTQLGNIVVNEVKGMLKIIMV